MEYKKYLDYGDEAISKRTTYRYKLQQNLKNDEMLQDVENQNEQFDMTITFPGEEITTNIAPMNIESDNEYNDALFFEDRFQDPNLSYLYPKSLKDFMECPTFFETINTSVDKTRGEIFLMILKFSILNSLSVTAITNLFKLVNTIFKTPIMPNSRYIIDKLLNDKDEAQFHAVCPHCSVHLGEFGRLESTVICDNCKSNIDVADSSNTNFFVLLNPSTQIADTVNIYDAHYDYVLNERIHKPGIIEDVYDSNGYRKFVKSLPERWKYNYISSVFNTNGAPKFESSQYSIWPLYLKINELPKQDRMKNLITCGLWFNKKKPDMAVFLDKFVDLINNVTDKGISCKIKGESRLLRLYIISCCVDSVARAPIQGIKQFNGKYGCNWCLHPGFYIQNSMKYPFTDPLPDSRTHEETVKVILELSNETQNFGIKYPSPLINLRSFDIVSGFVPDYLHCCLEGVSSQFSHYFFGSLSDDDIESYDLIMNEIAVPSQIAGLCRPLSSRKDWKAREWENYTLYYSIPILSSLLSKQKLEHWLLYVESLYILLKENIHIDELNRADRMLHLFVWDTEELYGIQAMTFNLHQLLHLCASVANWGPLWTNSTFSFESANYYLLRAIKCAKGVTHQIVRFINLNQNLLILEEFVNRRASYQVMTFCNEVLENKIHNSIEINSIRYFGRGDDIDNDIFENISDITDSMEFYGKIVKAGCLYECYNKRKRRSNNSFAELKSGIFINIICFMVDKSNGIERTLCKIVHTKDYLTSYKMMQKVEFIDNDIKFISTADIVNICTYMKIKNLTLLCPIPNLLHY